MVTIKRASSELSPSALRKCEMYCVRFPSSTKVSPHTACSNSSLVTKRLGFCTRKRRTSNALGVRETGESARHSARLSGSRTNCPKRYKLFVGISLSRDSEFFIFFQRFLKDFRTLRLENTPRYASEGVRREIVERRDIKTRFLEGKAALRSSMLSATDRPLSKTGRRQASLRTNVGRNFVNWRNFASRSSIKF